MDIQTGKALSESQTQYSIHQIKVTPSHIPLCIFRLLADIIRMRWATPVHMATRNQ